MSTWTTEDGTTIYFELYGGSDPQKPALLLLPGLLGAIKSQWRAFLQPLAADFRLVLMDLRGHGRSTNEAEKLTLNAMRQDISGLLDYLNMDVVNVAGYSIGGYLGILLAASEPRRVPRLLIHATKFYWTPDAAAKMIQQLDPEFMAEKVPTYANQLMQEHGARQWRLLVRQAAELTESMAKDGITEKQVQNFQCPLLVSVGDRDELVPLVEAQRLSRIVPHGELIVLPGVRHPFSSLRTMPLLPMIKYFFTEA